MSDAIPESLGGYGPIAAEWRELRKALNDLLGWMPDTDRTGRPGRKRTTPMVRAKIHEEDIRAARALLDTSAAITA